MAAPIDTYFDQAEHWHDALHSLRKILAACPLQENLKWGKPCYTHDGANIAIIQPMKDCLALMFFKGSLMKDPAKLLKAPGPNSRHGRRFEFHHSDDITAHENAIKSYVAEAIEIEKAGLTVETDEELDLVVELQVELQKDPKLKEAFEALTPGRQRGYNLYVSGAKQAATRTTRIEKYREKILSGKGVHDR
jgi:uncharacterized protein YdeI (YjbR/CyaY-like superfamily)